MKQVADSISKTSTATTTNRARLTSVLVWECERVTDSYQGSNPLGEDFVLFSPITPKQLRFYPVHSHTTQKSALGFTLDPHRTSSGCTITFYHTAQKLSVLFSALSIPGSLGDLQPPEINCSWRH